MGYPTGFDADAECTSSDEKSDTEGKNETMSSISSNNTGNSTADTSATLEVSTALKRSSDGEMWSLVFFFSGVFFFPLLPEEDGILVRVVGEELRERFQSQICHRLCVTVDK